MAMSRFVSQSLSRASLCPSISKIGHLRHRSSKTHHGQFIEVDLDASSSSSDSGEVIAVGIKKLEEAIHSIMVRRAAPDWLPFLPGYSYWVPPHASSLGNHPSGSMLEAIEKMHSSGGMKRKNRGLRNELSEDEQLSLSSAKGWPSSAFFIEGTSPIHPIQVVKLDMNIQADEDNADEASNSQDAKE